VIESFEGEADGIHEGVAGSAGGIFPVRDQLLAQRALAIERHRGDDADRRLGHRRAQQLLHDEAAALGRIVALVLGQRHEEARLPEDPDAISDGRRRRGGGGHTIGGGGRLARKDRGAREELAE
jgi:hypothetical protein